MQEPLVLAASQGAVRTLTAPAIKKGEVIDGTVGHPGAAAAGQGSLLGSFPKSTVGDTDRAVAAAHEAYQSWRLYPAPKRAEILFRVAEALRGVDVTIEAGARIGARRSALSSWPRHM